ncbi:MAG: altronate dehydratase [Ruminococcaceae bacterium]|nr:altronate dehydratase [Oscillospiraceae bacterium]
MQIHEKDNVEVDLANGHKYAVRPILAGEQIIKYGYPIGVAAADIQKGEHVHSHNMRTGLGESEEYAYEPKLSSLQSPASVPTFMGYRRRDGSVAVRNEIWIIPTVGCINHVAEQLANKTGAFAYTHPFGCSQLGSDKATTEKILCGLIRHPNAAGVLVVGLGCENSNIGEIKKRLGEYDAERVRFLNCQDESDEVATGIALIEELKSYAAQFKREPLPISELKIGMKCGGSDGFSGITANPLVGRFSDYLVACGGTSVLTEVPEMFGAERILMNRCQDEETFEKNVALIQNFKDYFVRHGQVVYENPSPGNKAGGITTLEEKSLGCVQKGGQATVTDVLDIGEPLTKNGLNLLNGPGNDIVAVTNLTASGVHMILFTTGRGTPLGAPVPTVKLSTNTALYEKKRNWIDFNAGSMLDGADLLEDLVTYCIRVASGEETCNEKNGFREISIFKDGVVL